MRPPFSFSKSKSVVWKLLKATYKLVEAGRLWQRTFDDWIVEKGFEIAPGIAQLFVLRDNKKSIVMILAKVVDDFLLAGSVAANEWFHKSIHREQIHS